MHGLCNEKGKLEALLFTSGNVCDSFVFNALTKGLKGNFFADVGYLQKADILEDLEQSGRILNAATRKNMKRLLTIEQYKKLCKKNIIEICWGQLKKHFQLINRILRSIKGLFTHLAYSLATYLFVCVDFLI